MQRHQSTPALLFLALLSTVAVATETDTDASLEPRGSGTQTAPSRTSAVDLESLRNRSEYAALDEEDVAALAPLAASRWSEQLTGFEYLRVERFAVGEIAHWISIWSHKKTGMEFALVPGGRFQMGSPGTETDRKDDERQHWIGLDPFLIARTECTQAAWASARDKSESASNLADSPAQLPQTGMSPADVDAWCKRAGLALPTEAQWEWMCRAGTNSAWAMGADKSELAKFGNIGSAECPDSWKEMPGITESWNDGYGAEAAPVGSFAANAFGLFDVHGNVSEWTRDHYASYDEPVELGTGARAGESGERMARGGNFGGDADFARVALRSKYGTGNSPGANKAFGFRPSLDLPMPVSLEGWPAETFPLPPGFAPGLANGVEALRFTPGWRQPDSEEFWSYTFILWIEEPVPDAKRVGELLDGYYDGLMAVFAGSAGKNIGDDPAEVSVTRTSTNGFEANMYVVDAFATFREIDIRVVVDVAAEEGGKSRVLVRLSPQPPEHKIWSALEAGLASIEKP